MLKNYVKIAFRNFRRNKLYSFLNITGLSFGLACSLFVLLYVHEELSFDRFHENSDRIYRLCATLNMNDRLLHSAVTTHAMGPFFKKEFPEIEKYARLSNYGSRRVVKYEDRSFNEERFIWADSTLFAVFSFELIKGNPDKALVAPNTVVITEEMSEKYFGNVDPMGKNIIVNNTTEYTVTGVVRNIPRTSHFRPDFFGSYSTLEREPSGNIVEDMLSNFNQYTYFLIRKNADVRILDQKFVTFINDNLKPVLDSFGATMRVDLQPVTDIYLYSDYENELERTSDITYVYLFSGIGLFILLIACLNFMNLATARSANRAKEVGLRKVVGALRGQLVKQFLGESFIITGLSIMLAVGLVYLLMPLFANISGKFFSLGYLTDPVLLTGLLGLFVFVGFVGGSYPALFLSAFKPAEVLKGTLKRGVKSALVRIALVGLQFTVSIVLIIGTLIIYDQLEFVRNKRLGYEKEHILAFRLRSDETQEKNEVIISELKKHPSIIAVSASTDLPNSINNSTVHIPAGRPDEEMQLMSFVSIDDNFTDLYEIDVVEGRNFSKDFSTDTSNAVIINETAAAAYGWTDDPIGKEIEIMTSVSTRRKITVIGVVKDFHFESLHTKIQPLAIYYTPQDGFDMMSVRIRPDNIVETVNFLKEKWIEFDTQYPFEYFFIDEQYDAFYRSEERLGSLFGYFTVIAILIGCIGLFGLASFTAEQRTKELGIRKVLGASVSSLILLLVREFTKGVFVAVFIAWPLGYYIMNKWIQNFAYRAEIGFDIFFLAAFLAFVIAVTTVSYQAVKAALGNPVKALKYE